MANAAQGTIDSRAARTRAAGRLGLLALLLPALLHAQTYRSPLDNTASVAAPADIADLAPGNNTATDSNVLALQAQVSLTKVISSPVPAAAGSAVQYQITASNAGPSIASGVTLTDVVPAQLTSVSWTCTPTSPTSSCAVASGTGNAVSVQVSLGINSGVVLQITAAAPLATPATITANTASLTLPPGMTDPSPGDNTATTTPIPVEPSVLVANNDTFGTPIPASGGTTSSVLGNDTLRGDPIAAGAVTVALQAAPGGDSIDADGLITVPAGAPAGRTTLTYQICESISPQNCATATATLVVAPSAVDDSFNVTSGSASLSGVLAANDRVPAGATYTLVGAAVPGLTINADGSFLHAPAGGITAPRTFTYRACLPVPDVAVCADGTAYILVDANAIVAADDVDLVARTPGAPFTTAPVLTNDTFANTAVPLDGSVQLSLVDAPAGFTIDLAGNGRIGVPANAAPGRRVLTYRICEAAFPTNCSTATVTLLVSPDAVDDAVTTPGAGQPFSGSVVANDSVPAGALYSLEADAARGTVVVTGNGGFTYTPAAGNTGADVFSYRVCLPAPDGAACDVATVSVLVGANALEAIDDVLATPVPAGTASSESVLANDVFNGAPVTPTQVLLSLDAAPAGYAINPDGGLQIPADAIAGVQMLVYRLCERAAPANCSTAAVQVVVAPQATGEALQATAGVLFEGSVAGNDNPSANGVYSLLAGPAQGTATVAANGRVTYLAPSGYAGTDTFQYLVCLPAPYSSVCATATATVAVQASVLLAADDDFRGAVLTPAGGLTPSVLANDTLNGQAVTAASVSFVLTGTPPVGFFLESGGELRIPAAAPAGTLQLAYALCEAGTSNCDSAAITLIIRPEATDDAFTTDVGRAVSGNVAVNDNAPAGATYAVVGSAPAGLQFTADGSFTYTPPALLTGVTAFDYQVCLPGADAAVCAAATARITVSAGTLAANDDDFRAAPIDPSTGGTTNSLLANDTYNGAIPPDPADMLLTLVGAPVGYTINANGTVSIPGGAVAGAVTFGYQMCERALPTNCDSATVSLLLTPDAANDNFSTQAGVTLAGSVAANDNVPAGSTFAVTDAAPTGLVFSADGSFVYVPPTGTQGAVTFTYRVCLPGADAVVCAAATATLNVNAGTLVANDDDFRGTPIDAAVGGTTASVLDNDVLDGAAPPAPAAVMLQLVAAPAGMTLAPDGTLTLAGGTAAGALTIDYQLCEAALPTNCDSARATVLVAPLAAADTFSTPAGQLFAGNVGANDNAPVGAVYSVQSALPPGLQFNPDGRLLYEPPTGFTGPLAFTYRVCLPAPDSGVCSDAVATLNVNAGNVVALDDDLTATPLTPGGTTSVSVLANDTLNAVSPPPPGAVTAALVGAPAGYALDASGRLQAGAQAPAGLQVLSYQLCEVAATGNCASALIRVAVTPQAVADTFNVPSGQIHSDAVGINDNAPVDAVYTVASPPPGLLFSANGSFSYTPQPGTVYPLTFTYQVCLPPPYGAQCTTADATLTLSAGTLLAADDDFSAAPLSPSAGGRTASVLDNDSLNGLSPPAPATVRVSLTAPEPGISIDIDGSIVVAAGVTAGARTMGYQLCEAALSSNCANATARIAVAPLAVADALSTNAGVTLSENVGSNDSIAPGATFRVTTAVPAGLTFNADGSFTFVPPAGQTGAFGFSYEVCLPAPDTTACSTAAVTLNVNNGDLAALADDFTATALAPGAASPTVLTNDTLNAVTPAPAAAVALSLIGAPAGYSIDTAGAITVPAGVPSGRVALTYQICELAAQGNCASAAVQLLLAPAPMNDLFSLQAGQTLTDTVSSNDNVPPGATFSVSGTPLAGLVLDASGGFSYAPPTGTLGATSFTYQVCLPAPDNAVCAVASVTFNVNTGTLLAADDDFSATPLAAGGSTASVLGNDALDAVTPPDPALVSLSLVNAPAGFALGGDGVIAVGSTGSGRTVLTYQLCEVAVPTHCDSATAIVLVAPAPQPDAFTVAAGGSITGDVGSNDQVPAGAQFSVSGALPAGLQFNADGSFSYAPPAASTGQIPFNYQVCLPAPDATTCAASVATLTISTGTLLAVADDFGGTPLPPGGTTASVLLNDTLGGVAVDASTVTVQLAGAPAGYAINPDGTVSTPAATSAAVTLTYVVCERAAPTRCATATAIVVTRPAPVSDTVSTPVGQAVTGNVGGNDGVPAGSVFSVQGSAPAGLVFNPDGSFSYTPPAGVSGVVSVLYQVCLPAPYSTVCGTTGLTINVNTGSLSAADDDFTAAPLAAGATSSLSVLANDVLDGAVPASADVVLTLVGAAQGFAINPDGTLVAPAAGTSGVATLAYQVCERAAPANCANAQATVVRVPAPVADGVSTPAGQPVTGAVGSNDGVPPGSGFSVIGTPPPGLQFDGDGRFTYVPPAGTTGPVTFTYQVCLPAPYAAVCGSAGVTLYINAGNLVATDDDFRAVPLPDGGSTPSVLDNDRLDGIVPAPGSVRVTLPDAPAGITIDANGLVSVGAGAVRGAVTVTYLVCEAAAPANCDSATVSLLLAPAPQPDVISVAAGATSSGNVGSNDDVPPGARFSVIGTPPPGLQFNADGSYLYTPPADTTGQVGFTYSVCLPDPDSAVCATASVTLVVTTNVVLAVNDDFSATPVDPATGGTLTGSVLDNDTYNGIAPPPIGSVVAVLVNAPPGFTLTTQGQVSVAPGTASGRYALTYQLCENGAPANCSSAIITVQVAAPIALLAVDDSAGPVRAGQAAPDLLNVLANDTFNGAALGPAQVTFAPVATAQLQFAADGSLSLPAGVGVGSWSTTYTICLVSQPTVCDTATVRVLVEAGLASVALQDDWVDLPPNGALEIDVLGNDRMEGAPIDPDSVSLTLVSQPPYGTAEVMPRARIRFAARTWFAGVQTFDYAVCDLEDPSLCAQATVTIAVPVNTVTVADARMVSEGGEPVAWDALNNASSATAPLDPASLQIVASPANGTAECTGGWCTYTPQPAYAGTDSFRYQLCDVSVPTRVCDEGTIAVTVADEQAVLRLTKASAKRSAQIGDLVRYTITVENVGEVDANAVTLLDTPPPGFTFVQGGFAVQDGDNSARPGGVQPLRIEGIDVAAGASATVVYYLRVGAGTGSGTHTNRITAVDAQDRSIGNVASADVEVTSDPLLDESLVVGSVFDDRNGNGVQEAGERGIPGVRVAAVEGLLMETDAFGRYHLVGIRGGAARGRNFILKLDTSTLPADTRFTTPNPLVRRITPGLPVRFDFGVVLPDGELRAGGDPAPRPAEIELGEGLFVAGGVGLVTDHGRVLDKAAAALEHARGGRLLLPAAPGDGDGGRALQRAAVLAAALRTRLTPGVAAATRIAVVSGHDEQVLHNVRVDGPRGAGGAGEEGR